jgi:hypothetical protein
LHRSSGAIGDGDPAVYRRVMSRTSRRLLTALLLAGAGAGAAPAAATAATAPGLGSGTGGIAQTSSCAPGAVLVGITAAPTPLFAMTIVGRLHAICASSATGPRAIRDDHVGNLGSRLYPHPRASAQRLTCPAGMVVTGLTGRSGDLVDRIGVSCQALGADGRPTGPTTRSAQSGGHGGTATGPLACPSGTVGVGLVGDVRAGEANVVDAVALDCAEPPPMR